MRYVFLDYQAGTPVDPEVLAAMAPYFTETFAHPSALHREGLRAREAVEQARQQVAAMVHAESPEDIIFTSGGTESANLAIKGAAYANQRRGNHIVATEIDHPAVLNSIEFLEKQGFTSTRVKVDALGQIDPSSIKAAIQPKTILVCVHLANHDIGTIQPIKEIAAITAEAGIPLFIDAVAGAPWLPINVRELGPCLVSLSPHRFYGPKGVGILYRHRRARIEAIQHGGAQEGGRRGGTENVPGIVGAGVAAELARGAVGQWAAKVQTHQERLWDGLRALVSCLKLNGPEPGPRRSPGNLNLSAEFTEGEGQALLCDMRGIGITSGMSCVSKALKVSYVLTAIGLEASLAQAAVIMSLSKQTTGDDISFVLETYPGVIERLRSLSPMWEDFQKGRVASVMSSG